jgi:hypothetical protein
MAVPQLTAAPGLTGQSRVDQAPALCCFSRGRQGRQIDTEAAPIRYVAELLGTDTDSEKAIRWPIAPWTCAATRSPSP